jgi:hypothetical protein
MNTEAIRQSFQPANIRILFIGESAPASGEFFYLKSNMTIYTMRSFEKALGAHFDDIKDFQWFFMSCGCYVDDLSPVAVNHLERNEREGVLRESVPELATRIGGFKPEVIIIVLRKIEGHVREAIRMAEFEGPVYVLLFPGWRWQREYVIGLAEILRTHIHAANDGDPIPREVSE